MDVIVHQDPGINRTLPLRYVFAQPLQKSSLVVVIHEYICFVDPAHHDVVQSAGGIESGLAWHGVIISR